MPKRRVRTAAQIAASRRNLEKARAVRLQNKAKMASTKATSLWIARNNGVNIGSKSPSRSWDKADTFWKMSLKAKPVGKRLRRKRTGKGSYGSGATSSIYHSYRPDRVR